MTLIIATHGEKFIAVGADSRGTMGIAMDRMEKILNVSEHVCILICGAGDIGNQLIEEFNQTKNEGLNGASNIAREFSSFCRQEFAILPVAQQPLIRFMVAGFDPINEEYKVPKLFLLDSKYGFAIGLHNHGFIADGVSLIASYLLNKEYPAPNEMSNFTMDVGICLVAYAINETKKLTGDVGGQIKIKYITPEDGISDVLDVDVNSLVANLRSNLTIEND